jgi:hypothetical protein
MLTTILLTSEKPMNPMPTFTLFRMASTSFIPNARESKVSTNGIINTFPNPEMYDKKFIIAVVTKLIISNPPLAKSR